MKIIFLGTNNLAIPSLEALAGSKHQIQLVVTQPDRQRGRSLKLTPTPVKVKAEELRWDIFQPENPNTPEVIKKLDELKPDLLIVISYGHILSPELLSVPKIYPVNIHFSLLPKYRGAAPVNWAIYQGDKKTGVSIIKMNEKMDEGDIIARAPTEIKKDEDAESLGRRLADLGAELLLDTIDLIEQDKVKFIAQREAEASHAPKLKKEDGELDFKRSPEEIMNQIRALTPWPGTFTYFKGKLIKIHRVEPGNQPISGTASPGEIILADQHQGIEVACAFGSVKLVNVQAEGGRRMNAAEFLRGHPIKPGGLLGR